MRGTIHNPRSKIQNTKALRVLWIWHAAVVAEYQKPADVLGGYPDLDVALMLPRRWPERGGQMTPAETLPAARFSLIPARTVFTGFYYIYFYPALLFHLLRFRPDVIYCYEEAHTFIAALVLFLRRLFLPRSRVLLYAAQNVKKQYPLPFRLFERYCFTRADAILACGTTVAETLRSKGYRRALRVVPLPTDTATFSPDAVERTQQRLHLGLPDDGLVILYAGKLVEEKGLRTLMEAFKLLATHPKVYLLLAGGGPLHDELAQSAKNAGLGARLLMPGVLHNTDLPCYMNAADVFVLPSETRSNWREQFGRVAVEAMSCGVPVIGSDSGEIPYVLGDAGLTFPEGDGKALADCISSVLYSSSMRAQLSQRGRQRVLNLFSIEKVAAQHHAIYMELRGNRREAQDERSGS